MKFNTTSRRISLEASMAGLTWVEKIYNTGNVTGEFTSADWGALDQQRSLALYDHLAKTYSGRTLSDHFYRELYNRNLLLYRKFCFFTRTQVEFRTLPEIIPAIRNTEFCKICDSVFCTNGSGACWICCRDRPEEARVLKTEHASAVHSANWGLNRNSILSKREASTLEKYGYRHHMMNAEVSSRREQTLIDRLGEDYVEKIFRGIRATNQQRYGVDYALQSAHLRENAKDGMEQVYGVRYAMQNQSLLNKMFETSRRIDTVHVDGCEFRVQGSSAKAMLKYIVKRFGAHDVATEFSADYPEYAHREMGTFPDFYIFSLDLFVECKSWWTFMGRGPDSHTGRNGEGNLAANKRKYAKSIQNGEQVRWIIHHKGPKGVHRFLHLPQHWHLISDSDLRHWVNKFMKGTINGNLYSD